ncbi:hypothetical protein IEQ34_014520 [Dendrobium chrysotoxum]|uniref:Leucine-rich repeat-containing N-terminal plant-type domain-containing protein n=1 Tax=Dendrobium chrysotoxum TaxID=161865 RepID=A0AAV7GLR7_DENCH|nr:hypothetical protein IEQ34_014520 [Dendrobium chrysotoxum]
MERVKLLLLLLLALLFNYMSVGSEDNLIVDKQQRHCNIEEREALISFKKSLYDPLLLLSNWDIDKDYYRWKGVGCNKTTNHVITLDFSWALCFNISEGCALFATSFIPSLFRLQYLETLILTGPLPKSLKLLDAMSIKNKRLEPWILLDGFRFPFTDHSFFNKHVPISLEITLPDSLTIDVKGIERSYSNIRVGNCHLQQNVVPPLSQRIKAMKLSSENF